MIHREARQRGHYMNYVLNGLRGAMAGADAYFQAHRSDILAEAKRLRYQFRPSVVNVFRGLMLDPKLVEPHRKLSPWEQLTFLSFTEDQEIAHLFADPLSPMCDLMARQFPERRGYIIRYTASPSEILFHWKWGQALGVDEFFKDDAHVYREQQEVMLLNSGLHFEVEPVEAGCWKSGRGLSPDCLIPVDLCDQVLKNGGTILSVGRMGR